MPARLAAALLLLAAVASAGCTDRSGPDAPAGPAGDGLGALRVMAVDQAIRPVAGANVTLTPGALVSVTDGAGEARFDGLAPGSYTVQAQARDHLQAQAAVDVVAGEGASVNLQLVAILRPEPYHETYGFDGFMEAHPGYAGFVAEYVAPGALACRCTWEVEPPQEGLTTFIYEADGNVTAENPSPLYGTVYWEFVGNPQADIRWGHDHFPIRAVFERNSFAQDTQSWTIRLTGGQWVHVNTSFDVYLTTWYNEVPAPDWSFLAGDP